MKISYIKSAFLSFAAVGMLASCSNDSEPVMNPDTEFEGIILNVPTRSSGTRAENDGDVLETEGKINTLTVIAYKTDDPTATTPKTITTFNNKQFTGGYNAEYQSVPVKLNPGTYKIYVLANLDEGDILVNGTAQTSFSITEANLKAATISFTPTGDPGTKGLPMSCAHKNIKESSTATEGVGDDATISITKGQAKTIYADLTLCVAKVRVTVLNNTTPDLTMNESSALDLVDYTKTIGLYASAAPGVTIESTKAELTGGKYFDFPTEEVDDEENEGQKVTVDVDPSKWVVETLKTSTVTGSNTPGTKFAWQGTWYVPEHLFASNAQTSDETKKKMSTLKVNFKYSASNQTTPINDGTTTTGVERSNFYDHLYYVSEKKITLQVRVKPWGYTKSNIDLQDL